MNENSRAPARAFLKAHKTGVLTTISSEGAPRARLIYYGSNDDFSIYFLTRKNTRKAQDIASHHRGSFVVASEEVPQTLQIEGIIADVTDQAEADEVLAELTDRLLSNTLYGAPLMRLDPDALAYYRLTPTWIRFGDFTEGRSTDEVFESLPIS